MKNVLRDIRVGNRRMKVYDGESSFAAKSVAWEMTNQYIFPDIDVKPGDVILDIGAHVGIFSIYYALTYPEARILSFEPSKQNYENFVRNVEISGVKNVEHYNLAVTSDKRKVKIVSPQHNTGASSIYESPTQNSVSFEVDSITPEEIFKKVGKSPVKVFKIDCEGAEYEIFPSVKRKNFEKVEFLLGEFHHVPKIGFDADELYAWVNTQVNPLKNRVTILR